MIRLVLPRRLILRINMAEREKQSKGVAASTDSVNTLIPYCCLMIGSSGPIKIKPALIFTATAKIGRPRFNVEIIGKT